MASEIKQQQRLFVIEAVKQNPNIKKDDLVMVIARKLGLRYQDINDNPNNKVLADFKTTANNLINECTQVKMLDFSNGKYTVIETKLLKNSGEVKSETIPIVKNKEVKEVEKKNSKVSKPINNNTSKVPANVPKRIAKNNKDEKSIEVAKPAVNKKDNKEIIEEFNMALQKYKTAAEKYNKELHDKLLQLTTNMASAKFEEMCVDLVAKIYNACKKEVCGGVNDNGIDGKVYIENDLGFREHIEIQCKCRQKINKTTSENELSQFWGKVSDTAKAVFVTNGKYHINAIKFAKNKETLQLIDGARLTELMTAYRIGVIEADKILVIDNKYFGI